MAAAAPRRRRRRRRREGGELAMADRSHATSRYVRTSAQKARLVMDLIRGTRRQGALATLRSPKRRRPRHREGAAVGDRQRAAEGRPAATSTGCSSGVLREQGPRMKRVRPAPMGRAFRVVKRTAHLTVRVAERPVKIAAPAAAPKRAERRRRRPDAEATAKPGRKLDRARRARRGRAAASRSRTRT